jgi:hypothetical protein
MIVWQSRYKRLRSIKKNPIGDFPLPFMEEGKTPHRLFKIFFFATPRRNNSLPDEVILRL